MKPIIRVLTITVSLVGSTVFAQEQSKVVPGEYLIKFKVSSGGPAIAQAKLSGKASLKGSFPGLGLMQVAMKSGPDEKANFMALKNDPDVEYIEPNFILDKSEIEPNGPVERLSYEDVVSLAAASTNPSVYSQSSAPTGVAESWAASTPLQNLNSKIIVAVIDTGLDKNHDVFKPFKADGSGGTGGLWVNQIEANGRPGVDDDQNGFVDDISGWNFINNTGDFADDDDHGTHVSGIVVGAGQNIFSRPLKESTVQIMPLKFLGAGGSGSTSNAIRAIYYAVNNGARVINNSWGGSSYSRALHDAIIYAYDHRVLVLSAAGNYGSNNDLSPIYPANYDVPSNMAVASVSRYDDLSSFSNYGGASVAVASPGEYIESTVPGNMTMKMSGTSMATPFVAGIAARALREAPSLSGYQLKTLIMQSSDLVNNLRGKVVTGARVDALNLIQASKQMVSISSAQPSYQPSYMSDRSLASTAEPAPAAGCGLVKAVTQPGPGSGSGGGSPNVGIIITLLLAPLVVWRKMRVSNTRDARRYDRFKMNSEVRLNVGGRELVGAVNTISEGGLSFNADEALEKGGIVTMRIQSPDGREVIEVQGQVVWNEKNQAYGVQFANAKQGTLAMIRDWTTNLVKT